MNKQFLVLLWSFSALSMEQSIETIFDAIRDNDQPLINDWIAKALNGQVPVNTKDVLGYTALMIAAEQGNVGVLKKLMIIPGIEINAQNNCGRTALFVAAMWGRFEAVQELLTAPEIDVTIKDNPGATLPTIAVPLVVAAIRSGSFKTMSLLLNTPRVEIPCNWCLYIAIRDDFPSIARLFWALGAQEDEGTLSAAMQQQQKLGKNIYKTILESLQSGNRALLNDFLSQGYSLMLLDDQGNNPLHLAVIHNHPALATWLITYNKYWIQQTNDEDQTPLELLYGLWGDENAAWNQILTDLPQEFAKDKNEAQRNWRVAKEETYKIGCEGFVKETEER